MERPVERYVDMEQWMAKNAARNALHTTRAAVSALLIAPSAYSDA
jgi:hypothetical protein